MGLYSNKNKFPVNLNFEVRKTRTTTNMVKHKRLEFVDIPWILYENPSHFSHQAFIRDGMHRKQHSSILWSIVKYVLLAVITISAVDLYKSGGYTGKRIVHFRKYFYNELVFLIF